MQNANLAGTTFNWQGAVDWAAALSFGGFDDWRLPITVQQDLTCSNQTGDVPPQGFGTACTGSEMGHLFKIDDISFSSQGLFTNVQSDYWSGTEFAPNPNNAWDFNFDNGDQNTNDKDNNNFAWAVRPG